MATNVPPTAAEGAIERYKQEQLAIHRANARWVSFSVVLGWCNFQKNLRLSREYAGLRDDFAAGTIAVEALRQKQRDADATLASLEGTVGALNGTLAAQATAMNALEDACQRQAAEAARALAAYERQASAQRAQLAGQHAELARIARGQLSHDAVVDAGLVLLGAVVASTPLVEWPAAGLSWLAGAALGAALPGRRAAGGARRGYQAARARQVQRRVQGILKLGAAALLVRYGRRVAIRHNVHKDVGGVRPYCRLLAAHIAVAAATWMPKKQQQQQEGDEEAVLAGGGGGGGDPGGGT